MIKIDWNPDPRKLRQFAVASLAGIPLIGYVLTRLLPAGVLPPAPTVLMVAAVAGAAVCALGLIFPPAVRPVYVLLAALAYPIGLVLGFLLLPLVYFGVFLPVALILRLAGADPMQRKLKTGGTYWIKRRPAPEAAAYFRQY